MSELAELRERWMAALIRVAGDAQVYVKVKSAAGLRELRASVADLLLAEAAYFEFGKQVPAEPAQQFFE